MIDYFGDVEGVLNGGKPDTLAGLYESLGLQVRYEHEAEMAEVTIHPKTRVNSECVRGALCALTTRLSLR